MRQMSLSSARPASRDGPSLDLPSPRSQAIQVLLRQVEEGTAPPSATWAVLSDDERGRAARFVRDVDRFRFIEAHAFLRLALAQYLGVEASALAFGASSHGKPELIQPVPDQLVSFSLSHTSGLIALALAGGGRRLGVDVEANGQAARAMDIAAHFRQGERDLVELLPPQQRAGAVLRLWTRKEAVHKADGRGLSLPLDTFDVRDDDIAEWIIKDLEMPDGYVGAVAYDSGARQLTRVETYSA